METAANSWMVKLKQFADNEEGGVSYKAAKDAGISPEALGTLSRVQLFSWPMFVCLTRQQCALCKKRYHGQVAAIGSYIHTQSFCSPKAFVFPSAFKSITGKRTWMQKKGHPCALLSEETLG